MAKKQNPYHQWLGLPVELNSPNFFQLLEVVPEQTDDAVIANAARTRAQQLLDRLKQVDAKTENEQLVKKKLKARIVTAHETISSPSKRKQYAAALREKTKAGVGTVTVPPNATAAKTTPPNTTAHPPKAIPMAVAVNSPPHQPIVSVNDAAVDTVNVRPVRRRRKRSSMVPIVATLLVITVIGGLVLLLTKFNNVFDVLEERAKSNRPPTAAGSETNTDEAVAPQPLKMPENFADITQAQKNSSPAIRNQAAVEAQAQAEAAAEAEAQAAAEAQRNFGALEGSGFRQPTIPTDGGSNDRNSPDVQADDVDQNLGVSTAGSDADVTASSSVARVAANLVRVALERRDLTAAKMANERVGQLIKSNLFNVNYRSALEQEWEQNRQMIGHLEVFLDQLRSSAMEMPGGQDVRIGELVMAMLDSSLTEVTLRMGGRNEEVPYTDLPSSVAIAIGDQGSKKSVPHWNMAKAADLMIQSRYNKKLIDKAAPSIAQSIADGYGAQCDVISAYGQSDWQQSHLPNEYSSDPTSAEVETQLSDFRNRNGYRSSKFVKSADAPKILQQLLFVPAQSPEYRAAALVDAIAVAAKEKQFDFVLVATEELYQLANPDNFRDVVVTPIDRCMRSDMSVVEARHLVRTIINMLRQPNQRIPFGAGSQSKLLRHAQNLVEEFEFAELEPQLKRLVNDRS